MHVALTYFKSTGKYYSEGEYHSSYEHAFEVYREVRNLLTRRQLPGLVDGHSPYIVLVEPSMAVPALIIEEGNGSEQPV